MILCTVDLNNVIRVIDSFTRKDPEPGTGVVAETVSRPVKCNIVAKDEIVTRATVYGVVALPAHENILTAVTVKSIAAAAGRIGRFCPFHGSSGEDTECSGSLGDDPVVTEDDIVIAVPMDEIIAGEQAVSVDRCCGQISLRHHGEDLFGQVYTGGHVNVDARIPIDVVISSLTRDVVISGTSKQVITSLAADDHVVSHATEDRYSQCRTGSVDDVVPRVIEAKRLACHFTRRGVVGTGILGCVTEDNEG